MILDIPAIASKLAPEFVGDSASLSTICIRTTNPKYLLFRENGTSPVCVAQVGSRDELTRLDAVLQRIHSIAPELVAKPLGMSPFGDRCVHLQSGMPGLPWFVIKDKTRSRERWLHLAALAGTALQRLQNAVGKQAEWHSRLKPGEELRRQARICAEQGVELSTRATLHIEQQAGLLDSLGEITSQYQHGDFCLNNLLVSDSSVAIIDFDEFGRTVMPLHDEIGLALSIADLSPHRGVSPTPKHEQLRGLYLHHLLWRINQTHHFPTRKRARQELLARVEAAPGLALDSLSP